MDLRKFAAMSKAILACILFLCCSSVLAQRFALSGTVRDSESGEILIGATVSVPSTKSGVYTNEYGFFTVYLPADSTVVRFSFTGYDAVERKFDLTKNQKVEIELKPTNKTLDAVVIESNSLADKLNSTQMSMDQVSAMEAKKIPALFGEVDIIKTLQLKPGVKNGGEGTSGIYVRGGGPDQNLFLLDEATVYNPSHLFGLFSTFNGDAVSDVKLFKGGFPAEYGGKLSSVIDVRTKEANRKKLSASGGLGLISSRLMVEAPIVKDKASFFIGARRTYADVITRQVNYFQRDNPEFNKIPDYYFYDLNSKVSLTLSDKDQVFISGYYGRDIFKFTDDDFQFNLFWGNDALSAQWSHVFNPTLFLKTVATTSGYSYTFDNKFAQFNFKLTSGIRDYNGKTELTWLPSDRHTFKVGAAYTYHTFDVGRFNASSEDGTVNFESGQNYYGTELGAYLNEEFKIHPRLTLNGGVRWSGFESKGKFYQGLEPRASLNFSASSKVSFKAAYTRMFQYIHLISNSGATLPTDIWYPSNPVVQPQRSDQVAVGVSIMLGEQFLLTEEVYYKWLDRQVDFRDGAQIFFNPNLDEEFVFGKGWGYGNELYIEKKRGPGNGLWDKLTGWVGYTLSWSYRQFPDINYGNRFFPRYDRRHDVSVVLIQEISKRWNLTATWVYGTGQAISMPEAWYLQTNSVPGINPYIIPVYTERNGFRMPANHRMDLGLVYTFFPKWGESDLTLSIYNAYSRRNPFFIYFDIQEDDLGIPQQVEAKQVSLFPIIPSVTWNFKF
jgi:hypothetical protein